MSLLCKPGMVEPVVNVNATSHADCVALLVDMVTLRVGRAEHRIDRADQ